MQSIPQLLGMFLDIRSRGRDVNVFIIFKTSHES